MLKNRVVPAIFCLLICGLSSARTWARPLSPALQVLTTAALAADPGDETGEDELQDGTETEDKADEAKQFRSQARELRRRIAELREDGEYEKARELARQARETARERGAEGRERMEQAREKIRTLVEEGRVEEARREIEAIRRTMRQRTGPGPGNRPAKLAEPDNLRRTEPTMGDDPAERGRPARRGPEGGRRARQADTQRVEGRIRREWLDESMRPGESDAGGSRRPSPAGDEQRAGHKRAGHKRRCAANMRFSIMWMPGNQALIPRHLHVIAAAWHLKQAGLHRQARLVMSSAFRQRSRARGFWGQRRPRPDIRRSAPALADRPPSPGEKSVVRGRRPEGPPSEGRVRSGSDVQQLRRALEETRRELGEIRDEMRKIKESMDEDRAG